MFSDEVKRQRKQTIEAYRFMRTRDAVLGIHPTAPPKVIHHPRAFDKPIACQHGQHKWETRMWRWSPWYYQTIPILYCPKCGSFVFKGVHEGTETPRELKERHVPKSGGRFMSDEEMTKEILRGMNIG